MLTTSKVIARIHQHAKLPSSRLLSSLRDSYDHILASKHLPPSGEDQSPTSLGVGVITLNRPKALNALCDALFEDLIHSATAFNLDDQVGSIIITGKGKAFAAGADIEEMSTRQFDFAYKTVSTTFRRHRIHFIMALHQSPCILCLFIYHTLSFYLSCRTCSKNGLK